MLHPKTDEHLNPRVEVHHLVGKLSTAKTLLRCNVAMFLIRERVYAHRIVCLLYSVCVTEVIL